MKRRRSTPVLLATCASSTQGWRAEQQDRYCVESTRVGRKKALLLAVADGMGGLQAGAAAAETAITTVREYAARVLPLAPCSPASIRTTLSQLYRDANGRIVSYATRNRISSLGTTLVIALAVDGRFFVANVGDSRCYSVLQKGTELVTQDHSVARALLDTGQLSEGSRELEIYRHQLTRSLGEPEGVEVDMFPPRGAFWLQRRSALLLCTDGLYAQLDAPSCFKNVLEGNLGTACSRLVVDAIRLGSTDNVTVVAARWR